MMTKSAIHSKVTTDFNHLKHLEPGLKALEAEVRTSASDIKRRGGEANRIWYTMLKPKLIKLVGWSAELEIPELRTSQAYETAYEFLYTLLTGRDKESH